MKKVRIGMVGYGNVGKGLVLALQQKQDFLQKEYGINFLITAIFSPSQGCAYNPEGLSLSELVEGISLKELSNCEHPAWNAVSLIQQAEIDVIVEVSSTNLNSGEPAVMHLREAILSGKHIVTCNKGPVALHYKSLAALAKQNNVKVGVEGTVMSGTPALRLGTDLLRATGINSVRGILNGTCNFILSEMEKGMDFEEALKEAQDLGYAETDPSGDVEGLDTAGKVSILAQLLFDKSVPPSEFNYSGISKLTKADVEEGLKQNSRWKLIGSVSKVNGECVLNVKPELLPMSNPLANVMGATNAIQYETDLLGLVTLIGAGAGRLETAAAVLEDLVSIFVQPY